MYLIETLNPDGTHMGQVIIRSDAELYLALYNFGAAGQKLKVFRLDVELAALG